MIKIPELETFDPPPWLDDDELRLRPPGVGGMAWYAPDGSVLGGDLREQMEAFARHKADPSLITHTEFVLEAGHTILVSTAYLGLDHGWRLDDPAPAIIWETMVFWDGDDSEEMGQWRYATHTAAMNGHRTVVAIIERAIGAMGVEVAPPVFKVGDA